MLVVDRYSGYNQLPCRIQYCYAICCGRSPTGKDFPDSPEIKTFVSTTAPMLSLAMGLRNQDIPDQDFYRKARLLKKKCLARPS